MLRIILSKPKEWIHGFLFYKNLYEKELEWSVALNEKLLEVEQEKRELEDELRKVLEESLRDPYGEKQSMKTFICVILALTIPTSLLILLSKIRNKPLKSCGESCECIDEEQLGCDASSDYRFSNNQQFRFQ